MSYRVKTVCSMLGIPRPTLLAWERRHNVVEPSRSESGHRIYDDADVAVLRAIKGLVDQGYSIGEAVRLQRAARVPSAEGQATEERTLHLRLADVLARFDRHGADRLLPEVGQLTFAQAVDLVYMPLLRETGDRWAVGTLTVTQEHFISGWCREQLFSVLHGLGSGPPDGRAAVCALPPGEVHELGLLAVAIHLVLRGWRVTWLGADLPIREFCDYVSRETPRLVCLSTIAEATAPVVAGWARQLREAAPAGTAVAVGGPRARGVEVPGVVVAQTVDELLHSVQRVGA